ncbi:hypothetical protein RJ639_012077 [Escallonia herrerae]|uniref:HMA domain-containing protein n=1 Tax=Escallonia herrerae TaxID=1293975 RepID=A0AA89ARB0_9ASTE|nr:hypothetical protein RJ639_012077 [Escallonia herrerae]
MIRCVLVSSSMAEEKKKKGDRDKKKNEQKVVEAEFKVSMHCNGCERSVAKAISKIKGVERFTTDMTKHKVMITGRIKPEKVMKKLKKKTGKRVELVINKEDPKDDAKEADSALKAIPDQAINSFLYDYLGDSVICTMFSDENANACSIM